MDLGAGRRGVDMGPSALRLAGLNEKLASLGYAVEDLGNIAIDQPETTPVGPVNARLSSAHRAYLHAARRTLWGRPPTKAGFHWCSAAIIPSPSEQSPEWRRIFESVTRNWV